MFERAHHVRVAHVLNALDADLLTASRCYFGGGTALALRHGEYRESADIDFLVSDKSGYGDLRQLVRHPDGFNALTRRPVSVVRPVVADQYGIRTVLDVDGEAIKFEILIEGRIELETPSPGDSICGVTTLTDLDVGRAIAKAETSYRSAIVDDLREAVEHLRHNPHHPDDCMRELQMHGTPKAVLWDRIKRLSP